MSDVERITEMNHRRTRDEERMRLEEQWKEQWDEQWKEKMRRIEHEEKVERAILSVFWTIGTMLSGAALTTLAFGLTGPAFLLAVGSIAVTLGGCLLERCLF